MTSKRPFFRLGLTEEHIWVSPRTGSLNTFFSVSLWWTSRIRIPYVPWFLLFPSYSTINNSLNFVNFEKWLFYFERRTLEDQKDLSSTRHVSTKNSNMAFLSYLDNRLNKHFFLIDNLIIVPNFSMKLVKSKRCTNHK